MWECLRDRSAEGPKNKVCSGCCRSEKKKITNGKWRASWLTRQSEKSLETGCVSHHVWPEWQGYAPLSRARNQIECAIASDYDRWHTKSCEIRTNRRALNDGKRLICSSSSSTILPSLDSKTSDVVDTVQRIIKRDPIFIFEDLSAADLPHGSVTKVV
jgi:hypothetical protein